MSRLQRCLQHSECKSCRSYASLIRFHILSFWCSIFISTGFRHTRNQLAISSMNLNSHKQLLSPVQQYVSMGDTNTPILFISPSREIQIECFASVFAYITITCALRTTNARILIEILVCERVFSTYIFSSEILLFILISLLFWIFFRTIASTWTPIDLPIKIQLFFLHV